MKEAKRIILTGLQILDEYEWVQEQALVLEDGVIKALIPANMIKHHQPATTYEFPNDYYLVPGFIDLHIHGAGGKDVMDADVSSLFSMQDILATEGVTGFLATTMTAEDQRIELALQAVVKAQEQAHEGAAILGVHLEGPFIAKEKLGAQRDLTREPDIELVKRWQKLAKNTIKLVTVAPELPNALKFIQGLQGMDMVISVGHTNATYAQTCSAIVAGCTHATHLFNAMSGIHQREPGATGALLLSDAVTAEIIVDGEHLHPAIVDLSTRVKGIDRMILVTDAMRAKCLGDGHYDLGGNTVQVQGTKATLADGTLAGSTLRMPEAIKNMLKFTQCNLVEAIQLASINPARVLGLDRQKGSIAVGKDADVVVMNPELEVMLTIARGRVVFQRG